MPMLHFLDILIKKKESFCMVFQVKLGTGDCTFDLPTTL